MKNEERDRILQRLRRIEGQIKGIQKMIVEERGCEEVLNQLAAASAAFKQVAMLLVATRMQECLKEGMKKGQSSGDAMERLVQVFLRLG